MTFGPKHMAMIGLIAWQMATTSTSSEAAPEDCTPGPSPESILSKLFETNRCQSRD